MLFETVVDIAKVNVDQNVLNRVHIAYRLGKQNKVFFKTIENHDEGLDVFHRLLNDGWRLLVQYIPTLLFFSRERKRIKLLGKLTDFIKETKEKRIWKRHFIVS